MILILLVFCIISDGFAFRPRVETIRDNNRKKIFFARIFDSEGDKFTRMDRHLNEELERLLEVIPIYPETEDDIEKDSMEGYLREEFIYLCDEKNKINFNTYYLWRKEKGTFLDKSEMLNIFNSVVETYDECKLMEFIKINRIIDDTIEF